MYIEDIKSDLRKQGAREVERMSIKAVGKIIETNNYIMSFDQPKIPEKIMRCHNCQKYGHHEDNCKGWQVCGKCGQQDPCHHSDKSDYPYKCATCGCDHPVYVRSGKVILMNQEPHLIPPELQRHQLRKEILHQTTWKHPHKLIFQQEKLREENGDNNGHTTSLMCNGKISFQNTLKR